MAKKLTFSSSGAEINLQGEVNYIRAVFENERRLSSAARVPPSVEECQRFLNPGPVGLAATAHANANDRHIHSAKLPRSDV